MRKATVLALFFLFSCNRAESPAPASDTSATTSTTTTAADTMSTTAPAPAETHTVGHFQFWSVTAEKPVKKDARPHVVGQFGELDVRLKSVDFLGAPAQKNNEQVPNDYFNGVHLTTYSLRNPPMSSRHALVSNQFTHGEQDWQIGGPQLLLVPATKTHDSNYPPEAPKGPHFLCYDVQEFPGPLPHNVKIKDQFYEQTIQELKPKYLCVPVNKNGEGYWNETDHLALYEYKGYAFDPSTPVWAKDQFDDYPLKVTASHMLGVPSTKKLVQPPQ